MTEENEKKIISLLADIESNQFRSSEDKDEILKIMRIVKDTLSEIETLLSEIRLEIKNKV
jgi:hypothetical protein